MLSTYTVSIVYYAVLNIYHSILIVYGNILTVSLRTKEGLILCEATIKSFNGPFEICVNKWMMEFESICDLCDDDLMMDSCEGRWILLSYERYNPIHKRECNVGGNTRS